MTAVESNPVEWVTGVGTADRSGIAAYVHLIRAADDPERKPRPKGGQADKAPHIIERWDKTADVMFTSVVNDALWALVDDGVIEHTMEAPILFRKTRR